jgi:hypothetical protein
MAPKKGQVEKELSGEELQAQQQHNKLLKQAVAKGVSNIFSVPCFRQARSGTFHTGFCTRHAAAAVACLSLLCCCCSATFLYVQVISEQAVQTNEQLPLCKGMCRLFTGLYALQDTGQACTFCAATAVLQAVQLHVQHQFLGQHVTHQPA